MHCKYAHSKMFKTATGFADGSKVVEDALDGINLACSTRQKHGRPI
jgi:hypothetical protein